MRNRVSTAAESAAITLDQLVALAEGREPPGPASALPHRPDLTLVFKLRSVLGPLKKLQAMVGMRAVKQAVVGHVLFFLQGMHEGSDDMLHTVIQGPPGVGKTLLGSVLAEIYHALGIIRAPPAPPALQAQQQLLGPFGQLPGMRKAPPSSSVLGVRKTATKRQAPPPPPPVAPPPPPPQPRQAPPAAAGAKTKPPFRVVRRSDLIGKYLGHTAAMTQGVIDSCLGGVMFIDEAYALGNAEGRDSFSKECIDTINQNLSEKKGQLLVIVAGYKDDLARCFFAHNPGLERRFPFVYNIEPYSAAELADILERKVEALGEGWRVRPEDVPQVRRAFEKHHAAGRFSNHAGDVEALLFASRVEHAKRVFAAGVGAAGAAGAVARTLTHDDIEAGMRQLHASREQQAPHKLEQHHLSMYS